MKSALVIGGGITGCTAAFELSRDSSWTVDLIERNGYLGAGNKTQFYKGHPFTFGPRHFLTKEQWVYDYLNRYVPLRSCADHQFLTLGRYKQEFVNYPLNYRDIDRFDDTEVIHNELSDIFLNSEIPAGTSYFDFYKFNLASDAKNFEEFWIKSVGSTLYNDFINTYSKKMWMLDDNKLIDDFTWSPKGVTIKKGGPECWSDAISAYPFALNGYDDFFRISTERVNVYLNTAIDNVDILKKTVEISGCRKSYDVIINTISLDRFFNYCYGELPYIGRDLLKVLIPSEYVLPPNVYFLYYAGEEPYTRIVEYKKFTHYKSNSSLITIEIPSKNNKHYPLPISKYINIHKRYDSELPDGFYSIGRAGSYMYNVDIDDAIMQAFDVVRDVRKG